MPGEDYRRYFEILELQPDASFSEVRNAYLHLKRLYSTESIVIHPIANEFSEESRQEVLQRIEDAYERLSALFQDNGSAYTGSRGQPLGPEEAGDVHEHVSFSGETLRQIRQGLGIKLHEIAFATKIRLQYLENIESERFGDLPPEVYLRGYIVNYARCLSLDSGRVARDYMKRYRDWKKKS